MNLSTRCINFSQIQPSIEITVASLQAIPEQNKALSRLNSDFGEGKRFHFLLSGISITERVLERASTMQVKYVTKLVENVHNRFDSDAMSVVCIQDIQSHGTSFKRVRKMC